MVIVDRDTGEIVWNSGGKTSGQHDCKMIPDRLPGGGNILVFDNGLGGRYGIGSETFFSKVVEIDPSTGAIVSLYDVSDSGYHSQYFNSYIISSAQRLPNGNTLINEGSFGHFFEIAPNGDIVWEYVSPFFGAERSGLANDHNRVYRAYKVPPDWFEGFLGEPRRKRDRRALDQSEGH